MDKGKMAANSCDHEVAIQEIARGHDLTTQLRALLLPTPATSRGSDLAATLFEAALQAFSVALTALQPSRQPKPCIHLRLSSSNDRGSETPHNKKRKNSEEEESNTNYDNDRRRLITTVITSVPHYDGQQWRKYGEKHIKGSKYPRSYYRCSYGSDQIQGCKAIKKVQQNDGGDPPKYIVTYEMKHSCKFIKTTSLVVMDSMSGNTSNRPPAAMRYEDNYQKGLEEQPRAISLAEQEKKVGDDFSILPPSFQLETRTSAAYIPDICEVMSNAISPAQENKTSDDFTALPPFFELQKRASATYIPDLCKVMSNTFSPVQENNISDDFTILPPSIELETRTSAAFKPDMSEVMSDAFSPLSVYDFEGEWMHHMNSLISNEP